MSNTWGNRPVVIHIDGCRDFLEIAKGALADLDIQLLQFLCFADAKSWIEGCGQPDLLIFDSYSRGGMDDLWSKIQTLRTHNSTVKFILYSAHPEINAIADKCRATPVRKKSDPDVLRQTVTSLLSVSEVTGSAENTSLADEGLEDIRERVVAFRKRFGLPPLTDAEWRQIMTTLETTKHKDFATALSELVELIEGDNRC